MNDSNLGTPIRIEAMARSARPDAFLRGDAVVIGNLAGIVEWTSRPWSELTGFPLAETIDKPISHFLECAGIEIELVEFVAQRFLEGRGCQVAMPFDTLDGRKIDVHLEVEPIRDDAGDTTHFLAVAREVPRDLERICDPVESEHAMIIDRPIGSTDAPLVPPISLSKIVADRIVASQNASLRSAAHVDLALDPSPLDCVAVSSDAPAKLSRILDALGRAATAAPMGITRFVTILSGRLEPGRSHHSEVHPIPARAVADRRTPGIFLEVHDTGPHWSREANDASSESRHGLYAEAASLARQIGATLYLDSTPGCGNQALLVLEAVPDQQPGT